MATPSTADLPDTGDVIEFSDVPAGSLLRNGVRYRVEANKPGSGEYLLIDVASGHAGRVPAHELKALKWGLASKVEAKGETAASDAKPLNEGLLNLEPLPGNS